MTQLVPLLAGAAAGPVLKLQAPISIWGGVDPNTGTIVDRQHPDEGRCIAGHVLWLPSLRGSGGTPGALASLIRAGFGPEAVLSPKGDANMLCGLIVAEKLYGKLVPYWLAVDPPGASHVTISMTGILSSACITGKHGR